MKLEGRYCDGCMLYHGNGVGIDIHVKHSSDELSIYLDSPEINSSMLSLNIRGREVDIPNEVHKLSRLGCLMAMGWLRFVLGKFNFNVTIRSWLSQLLEAVRCRLKALEDDGGMFGLESENVFLRPGMVLIRIDEEEFSNSMHSSNLLSFRFGKFFSVCLSTDHSGSSLSHTARDRDIVSLWYHGVYMFTRMCGLYVSSDYLKNNDWCKPMLWDIKATSKAKIAFKAISIEVAVRKMIDYNEIFIWNDTSKGK